MFIGQPLGTVDIFGTSGYHKTLSATPACPPRTAVSAGTAQTERTLSISRPCYTATIGLADSRCGLPQLKPRSPLIAAGLRELGAEQQDLGRVIDPYQNNDERARSAVG